MAVSKVSSPSPYGETNNQGVWFQVTPPASAPPAPPATDIIETPARTIPSAFFPSTLLPNPSSEPQLSSHQATQEQAKLAQLAVLGAKLLKTSSFDPAYAALRAQYRAAVEAYRGPLPAFYKQLGA